MSILLVLTLFALRYAFVAYYRMGAPGVYVRAYINPVSYYKTIGRKHFRQFGPVRQLLEERFHFYSLLNVSEKDEFIYRLLVIRSGKQFYPENGCELKPEHELLISATIAQITFGLKRRYWLPSYHYIRVHPSSFYSRWLDAEVKGLTFKNKMIHISWRHYDEGISDPGNGICLGIHEFAHAFQLELMGSGQTGRFDLWNRIAHPVQSDPLNHADRFIRSYGFENMHEMWAVCLELFFEKPVEFQQKYPNLYTAASGILQQDMAGRVRRHRGEVLSVN